MLDVNELPALDMEAGASGGSKHLPVVVGQVVVGIAIGVVIAVTNEG